MRAFHATGKRKAIDWTDSGDDDISFSDREWDTPVFSTALGTFEHAARRAVNTSCCFDIVYPRTLSFRTIRNLETVSRFSRIAFAPPDVNALTLSPGRLILIVWGALHWDLSAEQGGWASEQSPLTIASPLSPLTTKRLGYTANGVLP